MGLHVARVELQHVVIDVHDRERHGAAVDPERLELQRAHGPGGVLDQDLVDPELELVPGARRRRGGRRAACA